MGRKAVLPTIRPPSGSAVPTDTTKCHTTPVRSAQRIREYGTVISLQKESGSRVRSPARRQSGAASCAPGFRRESEKGRASVPDGRSAGVALARVQAEEREARPLVPAPSTRWYSENIRYGSRRDAGVELLVT
jgi:hypothetical protein